jgi:hypothetical protein
VSRAPCNDPACFVRSNPTFTATDTMALFAELRELIDGCLLHGGCFFIIDANHAHRYVQGLLDHDGRFTIEASSNASLGAPCLAGHPLTDNDHARLRRLGWFPPGPGRPNWYRTIDWEWHYPSPLVAEILARTLLDVHHATFAELTLTVAHAVDPPARRPPADTTASAPPVSATHPRLKRRP